MDRYINAHVNLDRFTQAITELKLEYQSQHSLELLKSIENSIEPTETPVTVDTDAFHAAFYAGYRDPQSRSYVRTDTGEIFTFTGDHESELVDILDSLPNGSELLPIPTYQWKGAWWDKYTCYNPITVAANLFDDDLETMRQYTNREPYYANVEFIDGFLEAMEPEHPDIVDQYRSDLVAFEDFVLSEWFEQVRKNNTEWGFQADKWITVTGRYQILWSYA